MYADPGVDALLYELEERRRQVALRRLGRLAQANQVRQAGSIRRAFGITLVRLGAFVSGEDGLPDPSSRELSS